MGSGESISSNGKDILNMRSCNQWNTSLDTVGIRQPVSHFLQKYIPFWELPFIACSLNESLETLIRFKL
jgi:hypothetical protein